MLNGLYFNPPEKIVWAFPFFYFFGRNRNDIYMTRQMRIKRSGIGYDVDGSYFVGLLQERHGRKRSLQVV
jgi:hypothetical protein